MVIMRSLSIRRWAIVSLIVLTAGCNGLIGTDGLSPSPHTSSTPTEKQDLPPGITANGVSDSFSLAEAHVEALRESYTVKKRHQIRYRNGTVYSDNIRSTRIATEHTIYLYNSTTTGTSTDFLGGANGTLIAYSNGTAVLRKIQYDGNTSYNIYRDQDGQLVPPSSVYHGGPSNDERIAVLFDSVSNVSIIRENETIIRLRASTIEDDSLKVNGNIISDVSLESFTTTVQSNGLVREYHLVLRGELDGDEVTVTEDVRYTKIGTTSVDQPEWYDEAIEEITSR